MNEENKALLGLPLVRFAPFMAAGMYAAYYGGGPVSAIIIACTAAAFLLLALRKKLSLCLAGLLCGLILMNGYMRLFVSPVLEYADSTVNAELYVKEVVASRGGSEQIIAEVRLGNIRAKARLDCEELPEEGQRADAVITFGAHDDYWALYDLANGVLLSGDAHITAVRGYDELGIVTRALRQLRRSLAGFVERTISGEDGELALAVLFGMDDQLSVTRLERMRVCGAAHFTAVSGTHFSVFAAVLLGMIPEKRRRTRAFASLLFAPMAVVFFGASASVIRASVMFVIYSLSVFLLRTPETLNTICAAVTAVCLVSPATVLDVGFVMSALGVFGAGVVGVKLADKLDSALPDKAAFLSPVLTALSVSVGAVVCTAPVSAAAFGGVSLIGVLSSLLLMPLMAVSMMFALLMGATRVWLFSVPVGLAMKLAGAVIDTLGSVRGMWLTLSFTGAWVLAAVFAVIGAASVFVSGRRQLVSACCMTALGAVTVLMSAHAREGLSEIRFVGSSRTSAAVVMYKDDAVILISGTGGGLERGISQCMRRCGARRITCIAAYDADQTGALMIRGLSELMEVDRVYSNERVCALLNDIDTEPLSSPCTLQVNGMTIAALPVSEHETDADIAVYHGRISGTPESTARTAIYFSSAAKELPDNAHNALREDVATPLPETNSPPDVRIITRKR